VTAATAVERIDAIYRSDSRIILATLIRLLGDFDLAEEALQDAFAAASEQWPRDGIPANPRAWLISAGRFREIDRLRRRARFDGAIAELALRMDELRDRAELRDPAELADDMIEDDRLRLIFTCCHPALPPDAQVAMTLREMCGLTTEEIARAFLTTSPTIAQRIVRAKAKIRADRIPYEVPDSSELPLRLGAVLRVVYLIFTEGYDASSGESLTRADLSAEAIRLGRLLVGLLTDPEVQGLLALMLLHEARRPARTTADGDLVLLPDQDRSLWDRGLIVEGLRLADGALTRPPLGPYALQAGIAAVHHRTTSSDATDWSRIVELYDLLVRAEPSPIVELNRSVAIAMRDGPDAGLPLISRLVDGTLRDHHLAHSARADLLRRLGRYGDAMRAYERAIELVAQEPERRFLERRLAEVRAAWMPRLA
jgi:RNA polymerase sigma-70 factor (ECF subfamily)